MTWYSAGTVSVANNSNIVTGSGTAFVENVRAGDGIVFSSSERLYEILNVADDNSIALVQNYMGSPLSGASYAAVPIQGYVRDLADRAAALINQYAGIAQSISDLTAATALISQSDAQAGIGAAVKGWSSQRVRQAANAAIDDRTESGSFTPTVSGGTTTGTCNYTVRTGSYTLTDSAYTFKLDVEWSDHTGAGIIVVSGLPFSSTASPTPVICWKYPTMAVGIVPAAYVGSAGSIIYVEGFSMSGTATAVNVEAAGKLMISGTVQV